MKTELLRWRPWSFALVLSCGLTLGYFTLRTFVWPLPRQYQLDFANAQWIEPPEFAPVAYFRKDVFLGAAPEQAWLQLAATDNFNLIVNGHNLGSGNSLKTRVAGIYDIKQALKSGTNVIAVSISRTSYPDSAQLIIRCLIKEPGAKAISLISDETWRVTAKTGIVEGTEEWISPLVQEQLWPNAQRAIVSQHTLHINWVDVNPLLLQLPPSGNWILGQKAYGQTIFSSSVTAQRSGQEAWIQVASSGNLDLLVNGRLVTAPVASLPPEKQLPHLPAVTVEPAQSTEEGEPQTTSPSTALPSERVVLQGYDISNWMKKGPNTIVAAVRSSRRPASVIADGFLVRDDGTIERFATNSDWQVIDRSSGQQAMLYHRAVESGGFGSAPWGYLPQKPAHPIEHFDFDTIAKSGAVILLAVVATTLVWLVVSWLVALMKDESFASALSRDALFHAPITAGLLLLLLPTYDFRFPRNWSFQPKFLGWAIIALIAGRLLHLFARSRATRHLDTSIASKKKFLSEALPWLVLALIMAFGLALRYNNLDFMSFDHDEMGVIMKSKGIAQLGFPYSVLAGSIKPSTTYELVPYPLAFSGAIFGYTEWAMRLPACIMGTLCIGITALMGRRLFDWRAGLITAVVYACIPLNIRWAQNAFHLQQCQFLAILTFWLFYEAIRVRPLNHRYLTAAAVAFCATYLSWEGSAFILPALFAALVVVRWGEWWWLKELHLYRCLFLVAVVVIAQFCSRTIFSSPYLQVGSGLSNITGPSLFFLSSHYQAMFYVERLLLSENHVPFTLMLVAGVPFCWKQPGFRYVVTVLVALLFCHTNLLAALSPRYCYYFQPLLLLGGIAATITLYDHLISLAARAGDAVIARTVAHVTGITALALLFIPSNDWLLKDYSLAITDSPGLMTRMDTYRYDYRGAAEYVKNRFEEGDVIIPAIPHVFENYSGLESDYFLDTLLGKKVTYTEKLKEPVFVDKFRGRPALRNLAELREVTNRGRRTWVIFAPSSALEKYSSPEVIEYFDKSAKVVFESYRAKVLLIQGASSSPDLAQTQGYSAE